MAIPYVQWLGITWRPWQFARWPADLIEMMRAYGSLPPPRNPGLCSFVDQPCLRPEWNRMCGCIPPGGGYHRVPGFPFYRADADETTGEAFPVREQQLSFLDPPRHYWRLRGCGVVIPEHRWFVAFFGCEQGMYHWIQREKQAGCPEVRVTRVSRPPKKGSRITTQDVSPCWEKVGL